MATTAPKLLRTYTDPSGLSRELILRAGAGGSLLLIDRHPGRLRDERLLAHLHPEEPPENATLVCHDYLAREPERRRCRTVTAADSKAPPAAARLPGAADLPVAPGPALGLIRDGVRFQLERCPARMRIPELRWTRSLPRGETPARTISLREAIGESESYEPFLSISRGAVAAHSGDPTVSTITLRTELARVGASAIVLNRALREAVLRAVRSGETSMSEIAMRCGRVKRDGRGNESGETSWLARRVGLLAEGGGGSVTAWVHSDVLGLIARRGLGISPREVELG